MGKITNTGLILTFLFPGIVNAQSLEGRIRAQEVQGEGKEGLKIIKNYIPFTENRKELTKAYCNLHYGMPIWQLKDPKAIVIHSTHTDTYRQVYNTFDCDTIRRRSIRKAGKVNVGAHFVIDRDGTIYQLFPLDVILRHAIGYNYCALGIENVAKQNTATNDLTPEQIEANADLIEHLVQQYSSIIFVFGHKEYAQEPQSCLVKAVGDPSYTPKKHRRQDPFGKHDMKRAMAVRPGITSLLRIRQDRFLRR